MESVNKQANWKTRIAAPKEARAGEVMQVRTLIAHPMESGYRLDSVGKPIPRDIITEFTCRYVYANETSVAQVADDDSLSPALSSSAPNSSIDSSTIDSSASQRSTIEVFRAQLQPAISANPYLEFYVTAIASGELQFTWTDQHGAWVTARHALIVTP